MLSKEIKFIFINSWIKSREREREKVDILNAKQFVSHSTFGKILQKFRENDSAENKFKT